MHFNPEDNYYITLGVPQNAGPDDIRDRWKRLMLLYHPDRQKGGNEWVSERAKKVNEAYTELKDNSRRSAFDRKLAEQTVNAKTAPPHNARTMPATKRIRSIRPHENAQWTKTKKYLPKALIVFYLSAATIFILFIYYQNNSSSLENEFLSNNSSIPQPSQEAGDKQLKTSAEENNFHELSNAIDKEIVPVSEIQDPLPVSPSSQSVLLKTDKKTFRSSTPKSPELPSYNVKEKSFAVQPKKEKMHSSKEIAQKQVPLPLIPASPIASNSSFKKEDAQPKPSELSYEHPEQKNVQPHTENQGIVTQALAKETKAEPVYNISSQEITKDEVEIFIQKYVAAYSNNNFGEFMSLFSRLAVENNTEHYNDIQKAYKETFQNELNYYKLQDTNIIIDSRHALVTGFYHVNRYLSSEERWVKLSGNIRWKLAKENNILKIMSINYDK